MSVNLEIIFKSGIQKKSNYKLAQYVFPKLKALNIPLSIHYDGTPDNGEWEIVEMSKICSDNIHVEINTPTMYSLSIYDNCVLLSTCHRYYILREFDDIEWLRKEVFHIIQTFKANEVIYLPDNAHPLSNYWCEVLENKSYHEIKQTLLTTYGKPLTNYDNFGKASHQNEFAMDTFEDIKTKHTF